MILVDSDIVDILRGYTPALEWLTSLDEEAITLPGYVVMELMQGCTNKIDLQSLQRFIADFEVIWPDSRACNDALETFATFNLSHNLGMLDALIGQIAVSLNVPIYTFNCKHYAAIPNLMTIQPYRKTTHTPKE